MMRIRKTMTAAIMRTVVSLASGLMMSILAKAETMDEVWLWYSAVVFGERLACEEL